MELKELFVPSEVSTREFKIHTLGYQMQKHTAEYFPDATEHHIALIGVPENRNSLDNSGCSEAPDRVREQFYELFPVKADIKVCDLGNLKPGETPNDTYYAIREVVASLVKERVIPFLIGGSQDLTFGNFLAYEVLEQTVNIVSVDRSFDITELSSKMSSRSFFSKIILHQPNYLFNYSNLGYQSYFVSSEEVELIEKLYFDAYRLGYVRSNMEEVEPVVRNADILSFDISAIRSSDAPGQARPNPNGFTGDEACRIMRYAGMSDKLSSAGIYELNPAADANLNTAMLAAQMIWYFIDGYYSRKMDYPVGDKSEYTKYRVVLKDNKSEITFYKSNKSDRWWMDVPYPVNYKMKFERHHLVPCSYQDYQTACKAEMPDRWWKAYQKLC